MNMKDRMQKKMSAMAFAALLSVSPQVLAEQEVEIGNQIFTCTNRCNVSYSGGYYSVRDCCGGRVTFVIR